MNQVNCALPVRFRFHGELNDFLPAERRDVEFETTAGATDTLKHQIESLGVPHTEVDRVTVNGHLRALSEQVATGDHIEVFPYEPPVQIENIRFVLDGHLGRLAAYLRMLGFDTWYERAADDPQLAAVASGEERVLLTRDVGLLKRRDVHFGYCVRSQKPQEQLREVARRFGLQPHFTPFQRCMDCNAPLDPVAKAEVSELLPPHTRETKTEFSRCRDCRKIFWRGTHHARMLGWIEDLTAHANEVQ
jgi:uncharacterized protein with PIN domain